MKPVTLLASLFLLVISSSKPSAQVFYTYPDAPNVAQNVIVLGPYAAVGDNDLLRLGGYGRLGVARYLDVGLELVLDFVNGDTRVGAGADVKLRIFPANKALPFDLSLNAGVGIVSGDDVTVIQAPLGGIISSPFVLDNGQILVPYLGVYVLVVETEIERALAPDVSDTDVDAEIRGGVRLEVRDDLDLFAVVHVGRDALFAIGVNFKL